MTMTMDGVGDFSLHWEEEVVVKSEGTRREEVICTIENIEGSYTNMPPDEMIDNSDQMAAENLMFLAQDVVNYVESAELDPNVECVTEEVITDDWVHGGQERVEVPFDPISQPLLIVKEENDVPLPTDQDEYTAMRPWPCDFCSRRFRKKAALMNHMVAHQNDRPHACNLCGVRYVRKCDLMNHLKVHAYVPDNPDSVDYEDILENNQIVKPKKKRGRRKKNPEAVENGGWENMTSARTQQWSRRARSPVRPAPAPLTHSPPSPHHSPPPTPPSPPASPPAPAPTDPSRPFVCKHCGVGFAREKALQSHARVHGGDSPVECVECGELCWSREALASHTRNKHPHLPSRTHDNERQETPFLDEDDDDSDDDLDYCASGVSSESISRSVRDTARRVVLECRAPELFCEECGVAFQRADLLRRHVSAAHSYKRHDSTSSTWAEHSCDVCGETCSDALQLLAHAELHTDRSTDTTNNRIKRTSRGRNNALSLSNSRQFPCKECGKVFGSRSSQQIHVRIHTGERPYACRFCWKAFADGGTLRKHERIHTGEKPYACAVCPRAFNQRVVLREHVRSHHSAPVRHSNGGPSFSCVVCSRTLHSSSELVQHLIQHCDANTALKRQPQTGPRKYKRRRKMKSEALSPPSRYWDCRSPSPLPNIKRGVRGSSSPPPPSPSPVPSSIPPSPRERSPESPSPTPPPTRRKRRVAQPTRPKMIHTEDQRARTKQVRTRRPPRRPADDLRAIRTPSPPHKRPDSGGSAEECAIKEEGGPFTCEMCAMQFTRRDELLLHVPVHI